MNNTRRMALFPIVLLLAFASHAAPLRDYAWQLHHPDWPHMEQTIRRAPEFSVTEIELSHEIITTVDQLADEPATLDLVQKTIALCDQLHLKVYIWAKELNIGQHMINTDLDPNGGGKAMWEKRRAAYRKAFALCPGLTGVVLQFGSCPTEPWEISDAASAFNAATPCAERIKLIVNIVKEECDAAGKKLDVRDFNHSVAQQQCMHDGFKLVNGIRATIKEVPQDWQIYYPLNPLIGDVGTNENHVEFDLGCEYWGDSKVPFCMVDYLSMRMRAMAAKGITGVVVRAERGNNPALGTPNEINLYAMSRLIKDPNVSPDAIYKDWMQKRFHLDPEGAPAMELIAAFRDSFDADRKMFYVLNHWALEKSSQIPDTVRAECLYFKALPQWDPAYKASWQELTVPKPPVLLKIWQEKNEAVELASLALAKVEKCRPVLATEDYELLHRQFSDLIQCTHVWQCVTDAIFRTTQWTKSPEDNNILEGDARTLQAIANSHAALPLAPAKRINAFVADLHKRFPAMPGAAEPSANWISKINAFLTPTGDATINFVTLESVIGHVDYGPTLPDLPLHAEESAATTKHEIHLTGLPPNTPIHFRAGTPALVSGDYLIPAR